MEEMPRAGPERAGGSLVRQPGSSPNPVLWGFMESPLQVRGNHGPLLSDSPPSLRLGDETSSPSNHWFS